MSRNQFLFVMMLVGTLSAGGCALSPQVVPVQPVVDHAALPKDGGDDTVSLSVADARANAVLGYRGGVYDTATVTMVPDMPVQMRAQIAQGLSARGFKVAEAGAPANVTLHVEVTDLTYTSTQGQLTRTVEVSTTIKCRSLVGDVTRTNEYRDARTKEFVKPPTELQNEELVNESIAAALQRMLADAEFLKR